MGFYLLHEANRKNGLLDRGQLDVIDVVTAQGNGGRSARARIGRDRNESEGRLRVEETGGRNGGGIISGSEHDVLLTQCVSVASHPGPLAANGFGFPLKQIEANSRVESGQVGIIGRCVPAKSGAEFQR